MWILRGWTLSHFVASFGEAKAAKGAQVRGAGGSCARAHVCNSAAAAAEVHNAVDAAAALQNMVSGWTVEDANHVTVDIRAGCVAYQQKDLCIIFSLGEGPRVQFVLVAGLPPSFIDVRQAQEVCRDTRTMKPPQTTILIPLPPNFLRKPHAHHNACLITCCFAAAASAH